MHYGTRTTPSIFVDFYSRVTIWKQRGVKVLIALGGWRDSAHSKYSQLVNDPSARANFIRNAVRFIREHNFDGLDLDWEYPKCWQVSVDCHSYIFRF